MASFLPALFYLSAAVFLLGMAWRVSAWLRASVPLKLPLTPGPTTSTGVAGRLAGEVILFRSLFRADKSLWAAGWTFHFALVLLALGHFGGLVCPEFSRTVLGLSATEFTRMAHVTGGAIGILAVLPLLYLFVRRFLIERVRYLSTFSDYFALALLFLVIATGNCMRFLGDLDIVQARAFVAGLLTFRAVPPPNDTAFTAHMFLVCALLGYIPFSKLMHLGGIFFSPTFNQANNPRERRHVNPWDHAASKA
jgi:nitrate reductase gamma subunit